MTSTERFKTVMNILDNNDLANCSRNHTLFEKLKDDELTDNDKVSAMVDAIRGVEKRTENNPNKYPEYIMAKLRQRRGLEPYDTTKDGLLNSFTPSEAFSEVLSWEGLYKYDYTIKTWIRDIFQINWEYKSELIRDLKRNWDTVEAEWDEVEDEIREFIDENVYYDYPYDHYADQEVCVDIVVDNRINTVFDNVKGELKK